MQSTVEQAEHAWCQAILQSKKEILAFGTSLTKVAHRQKYDCRTPEAEVQQAVFKLYENAISEVDARIANRAKLQRICPIGVTAAAPKSFEELCEDRDGTAKEYLIGTLGQATFDKFEHRFVK
jgi:hypothetical protein